MTDAELTQLADLVADRLAGRLLPVLADRAPGLVDAAALAELLGVTRDYVYAHADDLGAVRVGSGSRPRLRFDPERARAALRPAKVEPVRETPRARKPRAAASVPLLPIGGGAA